MAARTTHMPFTWGRRIALTTTTTLQALLSLFRRIVLFLFPETRHVLWYFRVCSVCYAHLRSGSVALCNRKAGEEGGQEQ